MQYKANLFVVQKHGESQKHFSPYPPLRSLQSTALYFKSLSETLTDVPSKLMEKP